MTCLSKSVSLEIMKFFLNTSVPKILSERACVTSIGKIKTRADGNLPTGIY